MPNEETLKAIKLAQDDKNMNGPFTPFSNSEKFDSQSDIGNNSGISTTKKVFPYVALAASTVLIADKILTTGFNHLAEYTGRYEYSIGMNNFNTAVNHALHPVKYAFTIARRNAQWRKQNREIEESSKLIGDSIFSNKKVGV